jgi:glyoxylase-like metal-dependent hydrolase (beta-lactamase superfamily II)
MREALPGIFVWSRLSEPHGYDFNGTFVVCADGNLCIDPVAPPDDVLAELERRGVARVLVTNRNHGRAARLVRERTGARVAIHAADAAHARREGTPIDDELRIGERIGTFTVVAVPGKSPGEVALHDPARRLLIVGDAVIGNPPGRLSLLREAVLDDPARLRQSVRRLLELDVDAVLTGDGVPILGGAGARLAALVASFPDTEP